MSLIQISKVLLFMFISLSIISLGCTETSNKENNQEIQQVKLENKQMTQPYYEYDPPKGFLNIDKTYLATIQTSQPEGEIVIELFGKIAPIYVENFINLSKAGFYDNSSFHRVIPGFMAQAGTKDGKGGGPGYQFNDFFHPDMKHDSAGIVSMANAGLNTNSSQFFITYAPTPFLDPYDESGNPKACGSPGVSCHAVFGKVMKGMNIVDKITPINPGENIVPTKIIKIEIHDPIKMN